MHVNHGFDADGQLTSRTVTSNTAPTLTTVFQDHLTYDARGKIAHATIGSGLSSISSDEWEHLYDGFGALTAAGRNRGSGITADVNSLDALGNVITRVADSTLSSTPKHVDFSFAADKIFSAIRPAHVIPTDGGGPKDSTRFETYYYHDGNGNQIFEEHFVYEQRVIPTSSRVAGGASSCGRAFPGPANRCRPRAPHRDSSQAGDEEGRRALQSSVWSDALRKNYVKLLGSHLCP